MIDLIRLRLAGDYPMPGGVSSLMEAVRADGTVYQRARLGCLTLTKYPGRFYIRGSLAKYLRGDNVGEMTARLTREALDKLEAELGFSLDEAEVTELEIARTIGVKNPAHWYMEPWGTLNKFQKDTFGNGATVLYRNGVRSFQGYDKGLEADPATVPEIYRGKNLLRLELKLKKVRPALKKYWKTVGRSGPLTVADLRDPEVYTELLRQWKLTYRRIPKDRKPRLILPGNAVDLPAHLMANGIAAWGGRDALMKDISKRTDWQPYERTRARQKVMELETNPAWTDPDELTAELDDKVTTAAACYR